MNIWQRSSTPTCSDRDRPTRPRTAAVLLTAAFVCSLLGAVFFGSAATSVVQAVRAALAGDTADAAFRILAYVRLPRVCAAVLAGSALAVSGAVIQAVLQNPMAGPNVIGVNAGAGLAACLLIALFPEALGLLPWAAFLGALAACLLIYGIARVTGAGRVTITLAGVAVSSILSAGINTVKTVLPDSLYNTNSFLVGGLAGVSYERLDPACWLIAFALPAALLLARQLDVLRLGADAAGSLGMHVGRMRFLLLALASVLAGAAVSFAGLLGFVGLLAPHIARRLVGGSHRRLLPVCAVGGATLVLLCDLAARALFAPYEVPVGILLSFVGGPFFLALLLLGGKGERS